MQLKLFAGLRPFRRDGMVPDILASLNLSSMNIPLRLYQDRRHARRHRSLHRTTADYCVRGFWFLGFLADFLFRTVLIGFS